MMKSDPSQIDKAEDAIVKGLNIYEELRLKCLYPFGYWFLGEVYANAGQKDKTLEALKKAESMAEEMGIDYILVKTKKITEKL
jgi:tetratricopeptide (TPR) repeat protein